MENVRGYQCSKPTEKQLEASSSTAKDLEADLDLAQDLHALAMSCSSGHVVQPSGPSTAKPRKANTKGGPAPVGGDTSSASSGILKLKPNVAATRLRTSSLKQFNNTIAECDKAGLGLRLRGHFRKQ